MLRNEATSGKRATMVSPAFLKLVHKGAPVPGNSLEPGWINWIELAQVDYRAPPGDGTPRLVGVAKEFDAASPLLAQGLAQKMLFDSMTIDFVRVRQDSRTLERVGRLEFGGVTVTSIARNAVNSLVDRANLPETERVTFKYLSMKSAFDARDQDDRWTMK
jgi:hypothetical protein